MCERFYTLDLTYSFPAKAREGRAPFYDWSATHAEITLGDHKQPENNSCLRSQLN